MKKFKTVLLVFCALVYCFAVVKANFFTVSAGLEEPVHTPSIFDDDPSWNLRLSLTEDQVEKFWACGYMKKNEFYYHPFKMAIALGKTDGRFYRMSMEEVKKIIELNKADGPEAIFKAFNERQPYADVMGGNFRYHVYYLNDEGTERIVVFPFSGEVWYSRYDIETGEGILDFLVNEDDYKDTAQITPEPAQVN